MKRYSYSRKSHEGDDTMAQERVLNPLKRKVMRKRFPAAETRFGLIFIAIIALTVIWVLAQRNNFNPADRDISMEAMEASAVEDTLYHPPLVRWTEPGTQGGDPATVNLGIFPPSLLEGGWTVDGRVETYSPETLYEKINGAAEQYLSFGFQKLHYVTITNGDAFITTELYDQGAFANTLGIFAAQRDSSRHVENQDSLFFYATPVGAVAGLGRYYLKIAADSEDEAAVAKAKSLVPALSKLPSGSTSTPRPFTILSLRLGVAFDSLAYVPQDAFQYSFANDFWFGAVKNGEDARYFVHEAADAGAAQSLFAKLVEEQGYEHAIIEQGSDRAVMQHEFLETFFVVERLGNVVFGVDNANNQPAAVKASRRIEGALNG